MGSGALELLKWTALVLMTGDHIDAALFDRTFWILSEAGRIAMPLFAAVFGYNLVRIAGDQVKLASLRNKLLVVGAIAYPFHCLVVAHTWLALNILFAFAVAVQARIYANEGIERNLFKLTLLFVLPGFFLEFAWVAPLLVGFWAGWWRRPSLVNGAWLLGGYAGLCLVNGNSWALLSIPVIALAAWLEPQIPRSRRAFWIYYPAHLVVLAMLTVPALDLVASGHADAPRLTRL